MPKQVKDLVIMYVFWIPILMYVCVFICIPYNMCVYVFTHTRTCLKYTQNNGKDTKWQQELP